uniref:Urotensin-2 n=1 Tax=Ornithorhynchus anatinus TaxID=9258 RepID=A0A6I8PIF7_ORNAN
KDCLGKRSPSPSGLGVQGGHTLHFHFYGESSGVGSPGPESETSYQLSAVDEDANLNLKELDRASLLQALSELLDTQKDDGLRKTDLGSSIYNPIGSTKETLDGKDPATSLLSRLLTKTRKQSKKHVPSSNCFWKYCV